MESLINTFSIDVKLLLAQMINFAIVFAVLYFLALKPLMKVMSERSDKIERSVSQAKEIEKKLTKTELDYNKKIAQARKQAERILEQAGQQAEEKKKAMLIRAKDEIGQIIDQEKAKMQVEKAKTLKEARKELADLVTAALEKILDKRLDSKTDNEIIKKIFN